MMKRYFYSNSLSGFLKNNANEILGILSQNNEFSLELTQKNAWIQQINILKENLNNFDGRVFFEYSIPRMGSRIDVVILIKNVIFVLEFKVGEKVFNSSAIDQVMDYCLDLKNFHETSHEHFIAPILIATESQSSLIEISTTPHNDNIIFPIKANPTSLKEVIENVLIFADGERIDLDRWATGKYSPTPTIIEAAMALYNNHSVVEISRNDASAINLSRTSNAIGKIIDASKANGYKSICFVTGVPGAGKTLVGLDIATKYLDKKKKSTSVFLSGNGPLVSILREALTRDRVKREKEKGNKKRKGDIFREVKMFIQNVHHFRDECLIQKSSPPFDHVTIFDEAQRAWNREQTSGFMKRKKGVPDFIHSEPEFLVSCLDRHKDWAVIVCLVGGGQEINTGEAGIGEWIESLVNVFPHWHIYISDKLTDSEYAAGKALTLLEGRNYVNKNADLHLAVSMRSFRAENVSLFVKYLLDLEIEKARDVYRMIKKKYPMVLTRDLTKAKKWLKEKARGSERYGITVSSQAQRLKPYAIDVKSPINPIHWFLNEKDDVRSSYYLEDVATEFHIQGLELDWVCVTWDADFRYSKDGWKTFSFVGKKWYRINKDDRKRYLKNAYRVLLTRARQGMVIVVPAGVEDDLTRKSEFYDETYQYLRDIGIEIL
ncbi:MAG: DUF2075 domain-containing protein [Calditrichaceae bacterium]